MHRSTWLMALGVLAVALLAATGVDSAVPSAIWKQTGLLLPFSDAGASGREGDVIAMSASGTTIAAGGNFAVWVFALKGGKWSQQGPRLTYGSFDAYFGQSVALNSKGDSLVAGFTGGVVLYQRTAAGKWVFKAKLVGATDAAHPARDQGAGVSISAGGDTIASGVVGSGGKDVGACFIFALGKSGSNKGKWVQQAKLVSGLPGLQLQGDSVQLDQSGNTLVVGLVKAGSGVTKEAAVVFLRDPKGVWRKGPTLQATTPTYVAEKSVAISGDGKTVSVGSAKKDGSGIVSVWVQKKPGVWSKYPDLTPKVVGQSPLESGFGSSVALNKLGTVLVIGVDQDLVDEGTGATVVFSLKNGKWVWDGETLYGDGQGSDLYGARLGTSVSTDDSGRVVAAGAPAFESNSGAVWVWTKRV